MIKRRLFLCVFLTIWLMSGILSAKESKKTLVLPEANNAVLPLTLTHSFAASGNGGTEFDGTFYYVTDISSGTVTTYNQSGTAVNSFSVSGVSGLTDLAYDGSSMYGGNGGTTIYEMDFGSQSLTGTIASPAPVYHIAYDAAEDAFWLGDLNGDIYLVNRSGAAIDTILSTDHDLQNMRGSAYDSWSAGGPYLWVYSEGMEAGGPTQLLNQLKPGAGQISNLVYNTNNDLGGSQTNAGGLFAKASDVSGIAVIGGVSGGSSNQFFTYEHQATFFPKLVATITPLNPPLMVPPDGGSVSARISVTNFSADSLRYQLWTVIQDEAGDINGPNIGPYNRKLPPGGNSTKLFQGINIPASALAGDLACILIVGRYPFVVIDSDSMLIVKESASPREELQPTVSVNQGLQVPLSTRLKANYPNPFNPSTKIEYELHKAAPVQLRIFNTLGQLVTILENDYKDAGAHHATWDGKNSHGQRVPSGIYIYQLQAGDYVQSMKMLLTK